MQTYADIQELAEVGGRSEPAEALGRERERLAGDLHDTVGQTLLAISLLGRRWASLEPGSVHADRLVRLAELASAGTQELGLVIRGLTFSPDLRQGLDLGLERLARAFQQDTGICVLLDVDPGLEVDAAIEGALFRVAHQALANAWRHARCATVRIELRRTAAAAVISVTDDGVGLGRRWERRGPGMGIAGMRRAIDEVGGRLRVRNIRPHGVRIEATVPWRGDGPDPAG